MKKSLKLKNEKLWEIDLLNKSKMLLFKLPLFCTLLVSNSYAAEKLNLQDARSSSEFCQVLRASGKGFIPTERIMEDAYYVKYSKRVRCNSIPLEVLKKQTNSTYAFLFGAYFGVVVENNDRCGKIIYDGLVLNAKGRKLETKEDMLQVGNELKQDQSVMRAYQACAL